jgi:FtsP/CotA-like multicopper oxidase with cupredoxin domain
VAKIFSHAKGDTKHYFLSLDEFNGAPDGFLRSMYGFNGRSPGEPITANVGDRLVIQVTNNFSTNVGSTIHWHGVLQRGSNAMDGVPFVTQSLIFPGETYVYNFTADDAGTFFYHAHYLEQYIQGLRGPFIVYNPEEHDIYHNQAVFLADWYHKDADYLRDHMYLTPMSMGMEPVPSSGQINGVGQNNSCHSTSSCKYSVARATRATSVCGTFSAFADLLKWQRAQIAKAKMKAAVSSDTADDDLAYEYKITRLRVINGGSFAVYNFSVDDHAFWVLEVDGQPVVPELTR